MAEADDDLVLRLLREISAELSSQSAKMRAIEDTMAMIEHHAGEVKRRVTVAVWAVALHTLEKSR